MTVYGKHKLDGLTKHQRYYSRNREKEISRTSSKNRPERAKSMNEYVKNYNKLKNEKRAGRPRPEQCELCGAMGRICYDHNHQTGKFRGWICLRCNVALGMVKDNCELLLKMVNYINSN